MNAAQKGGNEKNSFVRNQSISIILQKEISEKGKPSERMGRKASGLRPKCYAGAAADISLLDKERRTK
jgi:hypothetical protein